MTPMGHGTRAPVAYRFDDPAVEAIEESVLDGLEPAEASVHQAVEKIVHPGRRGVRWGALLSWTGGAIVSLALGLALDSLIRGLFDRAGWLGWIGLGLVGLFLLAVLGVAAREIVGLFRLKRIARLRLEGETAAASNERGDAESVIRELIDTYGGRADTARARRALSAHLAEIMDGRDLLLLAERELVEPLDTRARVLISAAARRVSVVTAVSPRAFIDVLYVLWESMRLIRRLSALYGGRPGFFGLLRLTRAVLGHLAVTGTMAIGDTVLQQLVGPGLAGRLSARLGEGVVNGTMTARIGLSAMDVCRPLPFLKAERPRLKDLVGELVSFRDRSADLA